jgi:hypothetical protein
MDVKTTTINDKKVSYVEVTIDWEGKPEPVRMKRLRFGEMLELNHMSAKLIYTAGMQKVEFDQKTMSEQSLFKSVILAPFPMTLQGIRDLDNETGQKLFEVFNELNSPSDKKKES